MYKRPLDKLTRQELYELIWSTPAITLAEQFGLSDVGLAKRCKKLCVPRPSRGYWAKIAAGESPRKTPLPPAPFLEPASARVNEPAPPLELPATNKSMHPVAQQILTSLRDALPDSSNRVSTQGPLLPYVHVTKSLISQAARSVHVIIAGAEARGIRFRKARSRHGRPYFEKENCGVALLIEERIVTKKHEITEQDKRRPSWEWKTHSQELEGKLTFTLKKDHYGDSTEIGSWTESEAQPYENILREVIDAIFKFYLDQERERKEWAEQCRQAEEKRNKEEEKKRQLEHETALREVAEARVRDLFRGAEWQRLYMSMLAFIDACEQRWRSQQSGTLNPDQQTWLDWARAQAKAFSPLECGYPDPLRHGPFTASEVPVGGPYPGHFDFVRAPTMPLIPVPAEPQRQAQAPAQPYPYWLRHQGR